jgi:predicted nucleic acid-binding protein
MPYMADTNILLRFIAPSDPNHILVRDAIYSLLIRGEEVCYTSQNECRILERMHPPSFFLSLLGGIDKKYTLLTDH